jgi:hypothetical protein
VSIAVVASAVLGIIMLAALIGVRVGRKLGPKFTDAEMTQLYGIQASLLGLLALLLGFSFAMGETRYDLRKQLLVDEADAIGTCWLRAATVSAETGDEIKQLLQQYAETRLTRERVRTATEINAALAQSSHLQLEMWSRAAKLAKRDPRSLPVSLLLQSLNEMIDLSSKRHDATRNHIPWTVLALLVIVAVAAMGWVGAGLGSSGEHSLVPLLIVSVLIALVITVIVDLDQPRSGLIRLGHTPLLDLLRSFQ